MAAWAAFAFVAQAGPACDYEALGSGGLPDSISVESVYQAIGYRADSCDILMKKWPYRKDTYIAYAEADSGFQVFALARSGGRLKQLARFRKKHEDAHLAPAFDFARYRLTKTSTAIGIRFKSASEGCSAANGSYESQVLLLLELKEDSLKEVLRTPVWFEERIMSPAMDDGSRVTSYFEETGILIVGKPGPSGYNNLIKKIKGKSSGFDDQVQESENQTVFTWKNGKYTGDDPAFGSECP